MDLGADGAPIRPWAGEGVLAVISWLSKKFSRDPGQLGLFDAAARPVWPPAPNPSGQAGKLTGAGPARALTDSARIHDGVHAVAAVDSSGCDAQTPMHSRMAVPLVSRDPAAFLRTLQAHGLRGVEQIVLTRNRRTMVSVARGVLRVHEGFAQAPSHVHAAIATFATSRNRVKRAAARDIIVEYPVPIRPPARRPAEVHPDDSPMAARLTTLHAQLNLEHFGGALEHLEILVSRRLARRLGHYTPRSYNGGRGEIVISRRHIRRDGWPEAIHTLLHEMVHQWQDETERPIDHGAGFRAKCRAVGIEPSATRMISR